MASSRSLNRAALNRAALNRAALSLGLVAIIGYGVWLYSFGVLLSAVLADEGWSESTVAIGFSLSIIVNGVLAAPTGALLDAKGYAWVAVPGAVLACAGLAAAASAPSAWVFAIAWGIGGGVLGATATYPVAMAVLVGAGAASSLPSIARLTLVGGFASVLIVPLVGAVVELAGWRAATAGAAGVVALVVGLSPLAVGPSVRSGPAGQDAPAPRPPLRSLLTVGFVTIIAVSTLAEASFSALEVSQTTIMVGAGVPIGVAATLIGVRGLVSIPARAALDPLVRLLGTDWATAAVFAVMGIGSAALLLQSPIGPGVYVALVGLAMGLQYPLEGLLVGKAVDRSRIGVALGVQQTVNSVGAALAVLALVLISPAQRPIAIGALFLAAAIPLGYRAIRCRTPDPLALADELKHALLAVESGDDADPTAVRRLRDLGLVIGDDREPRLCCATATSGLAASQP